MKTIQKTIVALLTFALVLSTLIMFATTNMRKSNAEEQLQDKTYEIVYNETNSAFAGINFTQKWTGALNVKTQNADNFTKTASGLGVVGFNFEEPIDTTQNDGFVLSFKTVGKNISPRIFFEIEDGHRYLMTVNENYNFIQPSGEVISLEGKNMYIPFNFANGGGSLNVKWADVVLKGDKELGGATYDPSKPNSKITKMFVAMDMRNPTYGTNITWHVGEFATFDVQEDNVIVNVLFDTRKMTYAENAEDTTKDINLADITKGTKINCPFSITGNWMFELSTEEDHAKSVTNFTYSQIGAVITVNYKDVEDNKIKDSISLNYKKGANYQIECPAITGYRFKESTSPLMGVANEDLIIDVIYEDDYLVLTVKYVDQDGKEIKSQTTENYVYRDIYEVTVPEIDGYTYESMDANKQGTIIENKTITIKYTKNAVENSGCNGSILPASVLPVLLIAGAVVLLKKKFVK